MILMLLLGKLPCQVHAHAHTNLVQVVAELALRDGPGALVVALEGCDLAPKHGRGARSVVVHTPVVDAWVWVGGWVGSWWRVRLRMAGCGRLPPLPPLPCHLSSPLQDCNPWGSICCDPSTPHANQVKGSSYQNAHAHAVAGMRTALREAISCVQPLDWRYYLTPG